MADPMDGQLFMVGWTSAHSVQRYRRPPIVVVGIPDPSDGETRAASANTVDYETWDAIGPQESR